MSLVSELVLVSLWKLPVKSDRGWAQSNYVYSRACEPPPAKPGVLDAGPRKCEVAGHRDCFSISEI